MWTRTYLANGLHRQLWLECDFDLVGRKNPLVMSFYLRIKERLNEGSVRGCFINLEPMESPDPAAISGSICLNTY